MEKEIVIERLEGKGIRAKVVIGGRQYDMYTKFARKSGYPDAARDIYSPERVVSARSLEGQTVNILAIGNHEFFSDMIYVAETDEGDRFLINADGVEIIEPITLDKATTDELLAELKRRLDGEVQTKVVANISVDADEIVERMQAELGLKPMPTRDDIVQQAKDDVKALEEFMGGSKSDRTQGNRTYQDRVTTVDFVVNREKRTIVALVSSQYCRNVLERGIAKCDPNDCFNEYIGKAIALRRALGLDVPIEYLNAREPEGRRVGDVVEYSHVIERIYRLITDSEYAVLGSGTATLSSFVGKEGTVIDDSARYKA